MSNSLRPHEQQHARPPCPSPSPGVYPNLYPSSQWCHPTISSSVIPFSSYLQSFPALRFFSNELVLLIRKPKYWSFSFSISPSNEYSGLICFRIDRMDLLAVQGTPKSLLQHHSSKASILQHSAFFMVQLSHPYMTTGKSPCWRYLNRSAQRVVYSVDKPKPGWDSWLYYQVIKVSALSALWIVNEWLLKWIYDRVFLYAVFWFCINQADRWLGSRAFTFEGTGMESILLMKWWA